MKIATVLGTRPEIIKMAPLIPRLDKLFKHFLIISNQHFSQNMMNIFLDQMKIRHPDYALGVNSSDVKKLIPAIKTCLSKIKPDVTMIYGDTNTTRAAALANYKKSALVHIEAGLRSFDKTMPEERNRIEADRISDYRLAPTNLSKYFLTDLEGYNPETIRVVGNLIVDTYHLYKKEIKRSGIVEKMGLKNFALLTLHRQENVDRQEMILKVLRHLGRCKKQLVFPVHPRTAKKLKRLSHKVPAGSKLPKNILFIEPLGYFDFMKLLSHSSIVITDSGGVQEEAITLKKPCVTLRKNTERWETLILRANVLCDIDANANMNEAIDKMEKRTSRIKRLNNPYGNGDTADKIVRFLQERAVKGQ